MAEYVLPSIVRIVDPGALCRRPYAGHPKGCPNYGHRTTCPPVAAPLEQVLNLTMGPWAVVNAFPLGEHMRKLLGLHPTWSERQLACCLYWQGRARAQLRRQVEEFCTRINLAPIRVLYVPEAHGVNVTATMAQVGVRLQWPPQDVAYQVALVGEPR